MALENLSTLDGILKDVYTNYVRDMVAVYSPVQDLFEKVTDVDWDGRVVREAAILAYNEGVGTIKEDAELPTAGNFEPVQFQIPMKYLYASFRMTKQMMEGAKTSKGAFKNAMRFSMDSLIRNLKRERARMLWGHGKGILALVNDATPSGAAALGVDSPAGIAGSVGGARFLRKGMIVAFVNPGDGSLRTTTGGRTISSVNSNGNEITLNSAVGADVADNDWIVRASLATTAVTINDTGYDTEPMGLTGIVDDGTNVGTYFSLSRTTYPILKSRVESSVGALSLDVIQKNIDIVEQQHDAQVDYFACHHAVRRAYLALLEADRRYTAEKLLAPDGGTKAVRRGSYVTFGNIPIIEDKFAPYDELYGLQKENFRRYVQKEGEWFQESGAILRQDGNKDTWKANYRLWENYFCDRPGAQFKLTGVTTNKVYVQMF